MRHIAISLLLAMLAAPALASEGGCSGSSGLAPAVSALAQQTNATRAARGQAQLRVDAKLSQVAQRHACDLARRQVVSHRDSKGRKPMARVKGAGFRACFSAENVAQGTKSAGGTVKAWQGSAGHARNQQDPRAKSMGFGVAEGADGRLYWVGLYAARCVAQETRAAARRVRPFRW